MGSRRILWLNPGVWPGGKYKVRRSPWLWALIVLALSAAVWFWRQKTGEGKGALEKTPHSAADTNVASPARTASGRREFTSAPVHVSIARTNPPPATTVPSPAEIASGANAADFTARPAQNVFEAQVALARQAISSGSLDGVSGPKTRLALAAFQQKEDLPATGELDASTKSRLLLTSPAFTNYTVTAEDLTRLRPLGKTWLEKSQQDRLDFESILELVAEKAQSHPNLIQRLNPAIDWTNIVADTAVTIPSVERPPVRGRAALARIHLENRTLQVFDENTNLVAHFPCSIAAFAEKRPVGELHVAVIAHNPNYTFDPENFPESAEARELNRKLILPPGPNNPVGAVWIGLDKPGYGIHGTPRPEQVGRAESHGCFRLANWNAEYFSQMAWIGLPVFVEP